MSGLKEDVLIEKKQKIHSFLDRRHSHPSIHSFSHMGHAPRAERDKCQPTLRLSLRFTTRHAYVHTHTHTRKHTQTRRRPKPMSDRAGERGPLPTSGKNPRHPRKKSKCASFSSTAISLFSTDFTPKTRTSRPSLLG